MSAHRGLVVRLSKVNKQEKMQLLKKIEESAGYHEKVYHGCCRSVLKALQSHLGLENDEVIKAATALGGGVARTGESCGGLLGGLMAIGLVYASGSLDNSRTSPAYKETMDSAMRLCDRFKKELGGTRCYEVQERIFGRHYDLRNPVDIKEFRESAHTKCEVLVAGLSARLAAEVIFDACQEKSLE